MLTDFTPAVATNDIIEADHVESLRTAINGLEKGQSYFASATGTNNTTDYTYSVAFSSGPYSAYSAGMLINFQTDSANAVGVVKLDVDSLGAKEVVKPDGSSLASGELGADQIVTVVFDATNDRFQLAGGFGSSGGSGGASALDDLTDVTLTSPASGEVLQHNGSGQFVNRNLASAGIAAASHTHSAADITSGTLAIAQGGTGSGTAGGARASLGLAIGTDVQAHDAALDDIAGLSLVKGDIVVYDGSNLKRLPVGSNNQVLTADSAQSTGVKWSAAGSGSVDGSGTASYLPKWSDSDTLTNSTAREPGSSNLGWGTGVLGSLSTGSNNIGLGSSALSAIGTGSGNVAVGFQCGMALGDGDNYNTHLGYQAGKNANDVDQQVAIGYAAGRDATGSNTVCLGYQAGLNAGLFSLFAGENCGAYNTGAYSVGLGQRALFGVSGSSSGTGNIGIGRVAGYALTSGAYNICIGGEAGEALTTGSYNVAIGYQAAESVQAGGQVVAVGFQALQDYNQTTIGVVAIGRAALLNFNTPGSSAVAVGYSAGSDFSGAAGGVMVGKSAGAFASGDELVAVGTTAGHNSAGDNIVAVGYTACRYAVGNENIGIGNQAVRGNSDGTSSTGTNNVGLGYRALLNFTSGGHNLAMGYDAGVTVTTGAGNTILGSYAGKTFSTGNYNVCLGHRAGDTATGSNKLFIHASSSSGATPLIGGEFDNRNLGVNGNSYGSGQGVVFIADRVAAPSSNPTGGGILYVESGALKFRGSSGTVTTVASA